MRADNRPYLCDNLSKIICEMETEEYELELARMVVMDFSNRLLMVCNSLHSGSAINANRENQETV